MISLGKTDRSPLLRLFTDSKGCYLGFAVIVGLSLLSGIFSTALATIYGKMIDLGFAAEYNRIQKNPSAKIIHTNQFIAKQAQIHDFIVSLPEGYDTKIGERGSQISGGQRQRIAIARAILRDAAILLLDEATASIDTDTEQLVQEEIFNAFKGKTILIVAHRLSTIQNADRILVMQEGEIVEEGSHVELLSHGGYYKTLVQSGIKKDVFV